MLSPCKVSPGKTFFVLLFALSLPSFAQNPAWDCIDTVDLAFCVDKSSIRQEGKYRRGLFMTDDKASENEKNSVCNRKTRLIYMDCAAEKILTTRHSGEKAVRPPAPNEKPLEPLRNLSQMQTELIKMVLCTKPGGEP